MARAELCELGSSILPLSYVSSGYQTEKKVNDPNKKNKKKLLPLLHRRFLPFPLSA